MLEKRLLLLFLLCSHSQPISVNNNCNSSILKRYGFEGLEEPIPYDSFKADLSKDFCPRITESCCSKQDFDKSSDLWNQKVNNIKKYVGRLFSHFQKMAISQNALKNLADKVPFDQKKMSYCRDLNPLLFSRALEFDEIYTQLNNALEVFSFLQKGFYCMVCDSKNHGFFQASVKQNVVQLNREFCANLLFFFKEYVAYKLFFFDPMIINLNFLSNCLNKNNENILKVTYSASYVKMKNCVLFNESCEVLCTQFRLGGSFGLFLGELKHYDQVSDLIDSLLEKFSGVTFEESKEDKEALDTRFFEGANEHTAEDNSDLTSFETAIHEDGVNPFFESQNSNYLLVTKVTDIGTTANENSQSSLKENEEKMVKNMDAMAKDNSLPSPSEVEELETETSEVSEEEEPVKLNQPGEAEISGGMAKAAEVKTTGSAVLEVVLALAVVFVGI